MTTHSSGGPWLVLCISNPISSGTWGKVPEVPDCHRLSPIVPVKTSVTSAFVVVGVQGPHARCRMSLVSTLFITCACRLSRGGLSTTRGNPDNSSHRAPRCLVALLQV